jgi:hypothetical protein
MPAGSKPGERRGGRQKGVRNKATTEFGEFCRNFIMDRVGMRKMRKMYRDGELHPSIVNKIIAHGWGEPPQRLEHVGDEQRPITIVHEFYQEPAK